MGHGTVGRMTAFEEEQVSTQQAYTLMDAGTFALSDSSLKDEDIIFNLVGQRVAKPQKGIIIQNGKRSWLSKSRVFWYIFLPYLL